MATLLPEGKQSFNNSAGVPLVGGKLYTYDAGTNTPRATYQDAAATTPNTNPVVLDARGEATVFWSGAYKTVLKDASDVTIWTIDNVSTDSTRSDLSASSGSSLVGFIQAGIGAVARTLQDKVRETISILDYCSDNLKASIRDNIWSGVGYATSVTAEFTSIFSQLYSNGISRVFFPKGTYYFATPVTLNFDLQQAVSIHGDSAVSYSFGNIDVGTIFEAPAGSGMFIISKTNLLVDGGYAFTAERIGFRTKGAGKASYAIKSLIGGAPERPFIVKQCSFKGITNAIVSDLSGTGGLTTGLCQVIIRENTFVQCVNALYGTGGLSSIMDLVFCDNVSENGGSILVDSPGAGGTFNISDNLLEGQVNAIVLNLGFASGSISRNYFELNTGYLMNVSATNPQSTLTISNNYIYNSPAGTCAFANLRVVSDIIEVPTQVDRLQLGSYLVSSGNAVGATAVNCINFLQDVPSVASNTASPSGVTVVSDNSGGATITNTPFGNARLSGAISAPFGTWRTPAVTFAVGDIVVFNFLVRTITGGSVYVAMYDNAYGNAAVTNTSAQLPPVNSGWHYVQATVKATVSSGGNLRFRLVTTGSFDISEAFVYKLSGSGSTTPIPFTFPSTALASNSPDLYSYVDNVSTPTATATTMITMTDRGLYTVVAQLAGYGGAYTSTAIVMWDGGAVSVLKQALNGASMTITVVGANIQVTHTQGTTLPVYFGYTKLVA